METRGGDAGARRGSGNSVVGAAVIRGGTRLQSARGLGDSFVGGEKWTRAESWCESYRRCSTGGRPLELASARGYRDAKNHVDI